MSKHVRFCGVGALVVAVGALMYGAGVGNAGDEAAVKAAVLKIADALRKGDKDAAATQAEALAKKVENLEDVMNLFKPRKKGGLGVGKAGVVTPDGIELKLITLGRDAPAAAALAKEGAALEDMAYHIAAIAEITRFKPANAKGGKTKKDWVGWSEDMKSGAAKLAEAAKAKGAGEVKAAAAKINATCNSCHTAFRN